MERFCFSNIYGTDSENNDCKLFDAQKDQREIEKYGFGRETNPAKGSVFIVRLFGTLNRLKPVEVEVTKLANFRPVEVEVTTLPDGGSTVSPSVTFNPVQDQQQSTVLASLNQGNQDIQIPINSQSSPQLESVSQTELEEKKVDPQLETSTPAIEPLPTSTNPLLEEARPMEIHLANRIKPLFDNYFIEQSHSTRFNLLARLINLKHRLHMLKRSLRHQHSVIDEDVFEETDKKTTHGLKSSFRSKRRHIVKDTKF